MIGLVISIFIFNLTAFKLNNTMSSKQIAHLWVFTIAFQLSFDFIIYGKFGGYWYFGQGNEWIDIPTHTVLIPPINMLFMNFFPFGSPLWKQIRYIAIWEIPLLLYELLIMLPPPFGYFQYGWWVLGYSAMINPFLLILMILYYKKFIK